MAWIVVQRKLGRAGGIKERTARQREWDHQYGENNWQIGYIIDGEFISQEEALETIYYRSYEEHFRQHPTDLDELIHLAKSLHNPHAEATTGVDLQVPAIMDYLQRHNLTLQGHERVDIGSWQNNASHPISIRLSPLHINVIDNPHMTLEKFWQTHKCLAVWEDDEPET